MPLLMWLLPSAPYQLADLSLLVAGALANTGLRGFVAEREFSPRSVRNSDPKQAFGSLDKIPNMRYCFIYGKYPLG